MNYELDKIRKIVKITENDGFFDRTNKTSMMIGTIIMWISLAQLSSGLNFSFTKNIIACQQIQINFMLAGCGGSIGAHMMWKFLQLIKLSSLKNKHLANNYLNIGQEFEKANILST
jgi:hypothetical protein